MGGRRPDAGPCVDGRGAGRVGLPVRARVQVGRDRDAAAAGGGRARSWWPVADPHGRRCVGHRELAGRPRLVVRRLAGEPVRADLEREARDLEGRLRCIRADLVVRWPRERHTAGMSEPATCGVCGTRVGTRPASRPASRADPDPRRDHLDSTGRTTPGKHDRRVDLRSPVRSRGCTLISSGAG